MPKQERSFEENEELMCRGLDEAFTELSNALDEMLRDLAQQAEKYDRKTGHRPSRFLAKLERYTEMLSAFNLTVKDTASSTKES